MKKEVTKKHLAIIIFALTIAIAIGSGVAMSYSDNKALEDYSDEEKVEDSPSQGLGTFSMLDRLIDPYDHAGMYDESDFIALVSIDSIDGADNYAEVRQGVSRVFTYGRMTVIKSLKGDLEEGSTKTFYRAGGTMDFSTYCSHLSEQECAKLRGLNPDQETMTYGIDGDVALEEGKIYLAYLKKDKTLRATEGYTFQQYQRGLREIQTTSGYSANSDLKVLNNFTGEWENLSDVVKQDK